MSTITTVFIERAVVYRRMPLMEMYELYQHLSHLPQLRYLYLKFYKPPIPDDGLSRWKDLSPIIIPNLHYFHFAWSPLTTACCILPLQLPLLEELLVVDSVPPTENDTDFADAFPIIMERSAKSVKRLQLGTAGMYTLPCNLATLLPNLEELRLDFNVVKIQSIATDEGLVSKSVFKLPPLLRRISQWGVFSCALWDTAMMKGLRGGRIAFGDVIKPVVDLCEDWASIVTILSETGHGTENSAINVVDDLVVSFLAAGIRLEDRDHKTFEEVREVLATKPKSE